jgi:hypothetical protein
LLFHKALRHFVGRPVLSRAEEQVLIQHTIHETAQGSLAVSDQLRATSLPGDVPVGIEEESIDLAVGGAGGAQWAHLDQETIAAQLQSTYRKCDAVRAAPGGPSNTCCTAT